MSTGTMIASTRTAARRFLPAGIREPLGRLCGKFLENVFYPMQGLVFDLSGGRFRVDGCVYIIPKDATRLGFRACFLTKKYEVDERYLIPKHVKSTDSVLELGACLGVVSCITNKLLGNPKRHVVVEGSPFCIPALYRNRALNQCEFLIENCAVGNQKEAVFYMHPAYITGGSMQNPAGIPVRVPGRTLKEFRRAPEPPAEISGYTCIWPLWDGQRMVSKKWPPGRIFLFHKQRVRFFGMCEQAPEPDGKYQPLDLILHHQPKRKILRTIQSVHPWTVPARRHPHCALPAGPADRFGLLAMGNREVAGTLGANPPTPDTDGVKTDHKGNSLWISGPMAGRRENISRGGDDRAVASIADLSRVPAVAFTSVKELIVNQ